MQQQASIEIDRPIHDVFQYTHNNLAEWSLTVVENFPTDSVDDRGVGSTFCCVTENHGSRMEFDGTITKWEPPTLSAMHLVGQQFDIHVLYTFEELGERTRVTQVSVVHSKHPILKILFSLVGFFAGKKDSVAAMRELISLKQHLESGK